MTLIALLGEIFCLPDYILDNSSIFQVNKNATVCISLDELFEKGTSEVNEAALKGLMQKVSHMEHGTIHG